MLLLPALMLYLYGPREDRLAGLAGGRARLRPRYRLRADVLWLALCRPASALYMAYLALAGGDALTPFHAQDVWGTALRRSLRGRVGRRARRPSRARASCCPSSSAHVYYPIAAGSPFVNAGHNLMLLAFLLAAVPGDRRRRCARCRSPTASTCSPRSRCRCPTRSASQPLMSLPRFLVVLFPLSMWLAAWLAAHPRAQRPALVVLGAC